MKALAAAGVARNVLVFIDDFFSTRQDRNRVLERLAVDLDSLGDDDRVAIVAFDGHRITRLAGVIEQAVLAAATSIGGSRHPPGRRAMLLLSGGWPHAPYLFYRNDTVRSADVLSRNLGEEALGYAGDRLFQPLIDAANRFGFTLYPVDLPAMSYACPVGRQHELGADG